MEGLPAASKLVRVTGPDGTDLGQEASANAVVLEKELEICGRLGMTYQAVSPSRCCCSSSSCPYSSG